MSERNFKSTRWIRPPYVLVRWQKERPGFSLGIKKYESDMGKYGQLKDLYLLKKQSQQLMFQIIERGSLLACLKAFDRCAHFDRIVYENSVAAATKSPIFIDFNLLFKII